MRRSDRKGATIMERRKAQRINIPIKICFEYKGEEQEILSENISGSGINIRMSKPLEVGDKITVVVYISPYEPPFRIRGSIAWCKSIKSGGGKNMYNVGIRYVKILSRDKNRYIFLFCDLMINYFYSGNR